MMWPLILAFLGADSCDGVEPPPGMVCVPEGPAVIGSNEHAPAEKPQHTVNISTFLIDIHEVTNAEYARCEREGVCPKRERLPRSYRAYLKPSQPAVPIRWGMARTYCAWAGKRLPTEAEWEKVARNGDPRTYPWGNEEPTCELAHYKGCKPGITRPVGELPVGPYGVYDMAGNGYEWVSDWATACYDGCDKACGDACLADNPQGPCGGMPSCEGHTKRVLKGGSWYWPEERMRASSRREQRPFSGLHRFSFRCAADTPLLTRAPYWHLKSRPKLDDPQPPTEAELAIAHAVRDDEDVMKIKPCATEGSAEHGCRDPRSYVLSNEAYRGLFRPYIENLGGAYVGLGSDQAYDFVAAAKSRWAFVFDYDPAVVRVHHIIHAVLPHAATPQAFFDAYLPRNRRKTHQWIREALADRPAEVQPTIDVLEKYRRQLVFNYRRSLVERSWTPRFGWLAKQERYDYIRKMLDQGRIIVRKGNLLTRVALPDIAEAARKLNVPVRVYYESNAADQWPLSANYRENMIGLPFDEQSVALRTVFGKRVGVATKWLYLLHGGDHFQRRLARAKPEMLRYLVSEALPTKVPHLKVIGMPNHKATRVTKASR